MEAQKFPDDFDAIIAGAPANYQTHLHTWDLSVAVPVLNDPSAALTQPKLRFLNEAAIEACDAQDGVKDGLINNPRACKFDPSVLLCKGSDGPNCLTQPQLDAVKRAYASAKTKSGDVVFPGKEPGSESQWMSFLGGGTAPGVSAGSFLVAYNDANWDAKTFDLDRDLKLVDQKVGTIINAVNPDLSAFKAHGGKLLLYHGWIDTAISPGNTINYYESVLKSMEEVGRQAVGRLRPALYGSRHAALRRRPRAESDQLHGDHGALAREQPDARIDSGLPRREQPRGYDASAVPVSAGRDVQRDRQRERCSEFRL